jgi:DNA-binding GntR family transcriptional regulator
MWRWVALQNQAAEQQTGHRKVFREEIRNSIREAIFKGELRPGDRIIETYWAKEMGVSQGPVREAIRDLEAMGLVETVPFKGSRVRSLTEKDIQDNYSVRICLESKSVRDVIGILTDEEMNVLAQQLQDIRKMDNAGKKDYATNELAKILARYKIDISNEQIEMLIESAVKQMKIEEQKAALEDKNNGEN